MKSLLGGSPLVVAKDMVVDPGGRPLAMVRRPRVVFGGWLRWVFWRHRAKSFDLMDPAGRLICHAEEGSMRIGAFRLTVTDADGHEVGTVTAVRTGARSAKNIFTGAGGEILGEGRFVTKVKYGDIPKKLTHAFDDASGSRVATADQKPGGSPHQVRFQGEVSEVFRLLVLCLLVVLPGKKLGSRPPRPRLGEIGAAEAVDALFGEATLDFHRDRVLAPGGRVLATVREPHVPALRGLGRALSHNPETTSHVLEVAGPGGQPLFTVHKSAGAVRYDLDVMLPDGTALGSIKRSDGVAKPAYTVTGASGPLLARIVATEAFSADYEVVDEGGAQKAVLNRVVAVDEPWNIRFATGCDEPFRILIVAFAVIQDLMLDL
jgi:hypothetical protein